jgi:hypothetical protein
MRHRCRRASASPFFSINYIPRLDYDIPMFDVGLKEEENCSSQLFGG